MEKSSNKDKRIPMVARPAPIGWYTNWTGVAKDPATRLPSRLNVTAPGGTQIPSTKLFSFEGTRFLQDVELQWVPGAFSIEDFVEVGVVAMKSPLAPATKRAFGNIREEVFPDEVFAGLPLRRYRYVPSGEGCTLIGELDTISKIGNIVPVPSPIGNGLWEIDYVTGLLVPVEGGGSYDAINMDYAWKYIEMLPLMNSKGVFEADVPVADYFHATWMLQVSLVKESANPGTLGAWIMLYRK
jgi:hypothetical protein